MTLYLKALDCTNLWIESIKDLPIYFVLEKYYLIAYFTKKMDGIVEKEQ